MNALHGDESTTEPLALCVNIGERRIGHKHEDFDLFAALGEERVVEGKYSILLGVGSLGHLYFLCHCLLDIPLVGGLLGLVGNALYPILGREIDGIVLDQFARYIVPILAVYIGGHVFARR